MSGHSKWSTIKRKKGVLDSQRSKMFTKVIREITAAVKQGGSDINSNARLRLAVQNAKGINMPKDNIDRAISKGSSDTTNYTNIVYEGNGIKGSSFMVECMTDNTTRTVGEVRSLFNKYGGSLGKTGSVSYDFEKKSYFKLDNSKIKDIDEFLLEMIEVGADDIDSDDEENVVFLYGKDDCFGELQKDLENRGINILEAGLRYFPINTQELSDEDTQKIINFIDVLEDLDDVQHVYTNILIK